MTDIPRLDEPGVQTLARRIVTNEVFVAWRPEDVQAFQVFLALAAFPDEFLEQVGLVYEDWGKAHERSVNDYPRFLSAKFVHVDDRLRVQRECIRMSVLLGICTQEDLDTFDRAVFDDAGAEMDERQK